MGPIIELKDITKRLGGREILTEVGFKIERGEVFALVGPNGAGKTTTLRIMLGLFVPDSGSVRIADVNPWEGRRELRCKVGTVLERHGLYTDLSVEENLDYYAKIYRLPDRKERVDRLLEFVDLSSRRRDFVGRLSKGMKQKLALARAMLSDPDILFLDEPTSGIDPVFQTEIRQTLLGLSHEGKTVFINSHNLSEVADTCSRISIMNRGRCLVEDSVDNILQGFSGKKISVNIKGEINPSEACGPISAFGHIKHSKEKHRIDVICRDEQATQALLALVGENPMIYSSANPTSVDLYDVFDFYQKEN